MKLVRNEWESTFFGRAIYRVELEQISPSPSLLKRGTAPLVVQGQVEDFGLENLWEQISPNPSLLKRGAAPLVVQELVEDFRLENIWEQISPSPSLLKRGTAPLVVQGQVEDFGLENLWEQISPSPSLLKRGAASLAVQKQREDFNSNNYVQNTNFAQTVPLFSKEGLGEIWPPNLTVGDQKSSPLLQAKLPATAHDHIASLSALGFQFVDGEIRFSIEVAKIPQTPTACHARVATAHDLPALQTLMGNAFPHSRFRPPYFSEAENRRFYQHWITQAVYGNFDDLCLLIESERGELQGAVSLALKGSTARIGLLAVTPNYQRQGVGQKLVAAAINWAAKQQATALHIATQLSNTAAIGLYQAMSGKVVEVSYWFYRNLAED